MSEKEKTNATTGEPKKVIFFSKAPKGCFVYKPETRYDNGMMKEDAQEITFENHIFTTDDAGKIEFLRNLANGGDSPSHLIVFECKDMKEFEDYRQGYLLARAGMTSVDIEAALDETQHSPRETEILDKMKITGRQ